LDLNKNSEAQQNLPNVSSNQTQGPQPMFNPYMMPMMVPPNVKEMQPIFPFPYIVFPQPNGTCLIQPLYQMVLSFSFSDNKLPFRCLQ